MSTLSSNYKLEGRKLYDEFVNQIVEFDSQIRRLVHDLLICSLMTKLTLKGVISRIDKIDIHNYRNRTINIVVSS